ncbi:MAG: bifunctional UDP-N-acetylglucosamine diphosphorylase/glucosamine-1-phosphate N-acetyltransferase GlmU [Chloroflexi bacterium]|nr:bifunctional UDP-N-acetylglucosamine diphosphorylase/glucosamine-1-phosphate N-acetyltransferase GlmU [Chloroflexota bacterium]
MSNWATVVLAAGQGKRMRSSVPKVLHKVCGKEMVRHVVDAVRETQGGPVVLVVAPGANEVRQCLGDGVRYAVQEQPEDKPPGTGHALMQAETLLRGKATHVLVLMGDTPLVQSATLKRLMAQHEDSGAVATLLTSDLVPPAGLGHIKRDKESRRILAIVEEMDATEEERAIREINGGMYCFRADWLWPALHRLLPSRSGELYLTDLVAMAVRDGLLVGNVASTEEMEIFGVNTRIQLAQAEKAMRERILNHWMEAGVTVIDPASTYVDAGVAIGPDTVLYPNTTLAGRTTIGERCTVGPNALIYDSSVGDDCKVVASMLEQVVLESRVDVGPFSHLRPGAVIERDVHIGNFAEVKNSRLGQGTKMGHFSYMGDAQVGRNVNIGAGAITCNFDGEKKNPTEIGDDVFIGSDTMLVAPVKVGPRSATGAGAVVNKDVPPDSLAVGIPARIRGRSGKVETNDS